MSCRSRSGYVYVAVLFTTLIVVATVGVSLSVSTASLRSEMDRNDRVEAIRIAESEIHRLAAAMRVSGGWRSDNVSGQFSDWRDWDVATATAIDPATRRVRHRYTDPDGLLDDDDSDSVQLIVHCRVGSARTALAVTMEPDPQPLEILGCSVTCTDDMLFASNGLVVTERPVFSADDCTGVSGLLVTPRLDCGGSATVTLRGDLGDATINLPSYDVPDRYKSMGTEIDVDSLPLSGGQRIIQDRVVSSSVNPFGTADPAGIYWIDADGEGIHIADCRIDATLMVEDASEIRLSGGLNWNYPTTPDAILVTDSPITFGDVQSQLSEADRSTNFNPPAVPYRGTLSNTTTIDIYPTELRGFVYTSEDILVESHGDFLLPIVGGLLGRDITVEGRLSVRHLDQWLDMPPSGLSNRVPMRFVRGTWRRVAAQ